MLKLANYVAGPNPSMQIVLPEQTVMSSNVGLASEYWQRQGVKLRPPAIGSDVLSVFSTFKQSPTRDVIELYERLDGFADHQYSQNHFSLWSLAEIRSENAVNPTVDLWFADYLINAHYFSLHPEDQNTSSVHAQYHYPDGETRSFKVADSLQQFLLRLVKAPESVHVYPLGEANVEINNSDKHG